VVVRRLRDVGQKFSTNRRTVIITAPTIAMPPELASLVEYLDLPLPDWQSRGFLRSSRTSLSSPSSNPARPAALEERAAREAFPDSPA